MRTVVLGTVLLLTLSARTAADDPPPLAALDLDALRAEASRCVDLVRASGNDLSDPIARAGLDLAGSLARFGGRLVWRRVARAHYARPEDGDAAAAAIDDLIAELDSDLLAFFPADVADLAREARVRRFLDDLIRMLADPDVAVDLWSLARARAGSEDEAIRWLAVLFQDLIVQPVGHVRAVADRADQERLALAILALADSDPDRVRLYPDGDLEGRSLYHYYVPVWLARRLRARGHAPAMAFLAPFVMNTEYERLALAAEANVRVDTDAFGDAGVILAGPGSGFDSVEIGEPERAETVRDVYLGYRGALRGAGLDRSPARLQDFEEGLRKEAGPFVRRVVADASR